MAFQAYFEGLNDGRIDDIRTQMEELGFLRSIPYRDSHLYAVLKPTRHENLMRIDNIIGNLKTGVLLAVLENLEQMKGL